MKLHTLILTLLLIPMLGFASCGTPKDKILRNVWNVQIHPDSTASQILGDTVSYLLFNPKKVKVYALANREPDKRKNEIEVCQNFVRDSLFTILNTDMCSILQFALLADSSNYKTDFDRVKSPYKPIFEFEFSVKKETASVLISFSDFTWTVIYKGREICHYNYGNKQQILRYKQLLLTNNKKTDTK